MKALLLSANFFAEKTGISVTPTDCARLISSFRHQVNVVCGMPYYPEWRIRDDYRSKLFVTERLDSLQLERVWLYVPQKPSPLRRVLHELSFSLLAFLRALPERFDLVVCISPPLRPLVKWLYMMFVRGALLDGKAGITYAFLQSIYEHFIVLKTRELENKTQP